jgi:YD repeat-containing protein
MLGDTTDYDANGNLIQLPGMQMKYDALNRMMRVDMAGGTERYSYDAKNLRIWTQSADGTETFKFYQGTRNLASYTLATDASGNLSFTVVKTNIYFGRLVLIDFFKSTCNYSGAICRSGLQCSRHPPTCLPV